MKIEELQHMEATKTAIESKDIMAAILRNQGWVTYDQREELLIYHIRRYLTAHCRVPGLFTATVCGAARPLAVLRYDANNIDRVEAAVFLNGAVVRMSDGNSEEFVLFISQEDAEFWDYPTTGQISSLGKSN